MIFDPPRCLLALLGVLALVPFGGCTTKRPIMPAVAVIPGVSGYFGTERIVEPETGKTLSFEELIGLAAEKELIFVGEVHDNPDHHLIEVQILQALMQKGPLTVAMEFFQKPQQPLLDRYLEGAIDEEQFLEEVNWQESWGLDYHFYRPLLLAVKASKGKILAINAPSEIIRKVARSGLVSLSPAERSQLAKDIDLTNEKHREYLRRVYRAHAHQYLKDFNYFYQAQCAWEDTMAENIANYLNKHKKRVLVFTGNGHITHKFGIPDRTVSRKAVPMITVSLLPLGGPLEIEPQEADFVWLTLPCSGEAVMAHPEMPKK